MKYKKVCLCVLMVTFIIIFSLMIIKYYSFTKEILKQDYSVIFNGCVSYEKLGYTKLEDNYHEEESNSVFLNKEIGKQVVTLTNYKHIHYLIKNNNIFYCAAISNDNKKYILQLDDNLKPVKRICVNALPAKLYVYDNSLAVYYIEEKKAHIYIVDFTEQELKPLIEDISIKGSNNANLFLNNLEKYFYLYEYEYEEFIYSNKDVLYILFDQKCFEDIFFYDTKVLYKRNDEKILSQWTLVNGTSKESLKNSDRCFGFIDEKTVLFCKDISMWLFNLEVFYKYDVISKTYYDYKIVISHNIINGSIINNGKNLLFVCSRGHEGVNYYLMDISLGVYKRIFTEDFNLGQIDDN